jgi:hypothetical protein
MQRREEHARVLRVYNKQSVCLLLVNGPGAVIQADLVAPFSPRTMVMAQSINVLNTVPAKVTLGTFDPHTCKFVDCHLDVDIPDPNFQRVNYLARKKRQ